MAVAGVTVGVGDFLGVEHGLCGAGIAGHRS